MCPLPVDGTGIQIMVMMKHLKTSLPPDSRDNSSCESDIDRQELIDNYGSEKYLSKWNLDADDDNGDNNGAAPEQSGDHKQSENELQHLKIEDEDDAASLVSYNSVRDAGAPVKNTTSYLPYQIQPTPQHITLWQGYSGNIYFDPLRCQPMRINSSKPHKQNPKEKMSNRKTKSCSPSMDVLTANHISSSASSFHSLGSLRFASRDEKRRNTSCASQYGRLRKGFSDGKVTEPNVLTGHHHRVRCESAPESLVVSGGHLKDVTSDPIDYVLKHNAKTRLTSKSSNNFPSLVIGHKCDTERGKQDNQLELSTNLPPVETVAPSKDVTEPKPVFIIPFGALDDPVEGNNNNNNNKPVGETNNKRSVNKKKSKPVNEAGVLNDSGVNVQAVGHNELDLALSITVPSAERDIRVARTSDVNATVRREISDSSLSNYLRATPTCLSKQKKMTPKLSYTKRTMDMIPGSMSSMTDSDLQISSTTALYGGYLPSTRTTDTQLFRVERNSASQTGETNSLGSLEERKLSNIRPRKRNSNKHVSASKQDSDKCHLPVIGWHVS